ncbi:hypothetical protein DFJ74DRAFT_389568 [Hyaloraphidium curvatum]|nr:hypothetical protein DFJ74DRAFT_389568 [Hyaloraphidium curvatum]
MGPSENDERLAIARRWTNAIAAFAVGKDLELCLESPESARIAFRSGHVVLPLPSLEDAVRDAFIEDAYDGSLHLLTLRDRTRTLPRIGHPIVALVFWRDLDRGELESWVRSVADCPRMIEDSSLDGEPDVEHESEMPADPNGSQLELVVRSKQGVTFEHSFDWNSAPVSASPYEGWIKVELIGTHPAHYRKGYARILFVAVLLISYLRDGKRHVVLHVAGGAANIEATNLYKSLGFVEPPAGMFRQPNNNLLVLWSIEAALRKLDWRWFARFGKLRPEAASDAVALRM